MAADDGGVAAAAAGDDVAAAADGERWMIAAEWQPYAAVPPTAISAHCCVAAAAVDCGDDHDHGGDGCYC